MSGIKTLVRYTFAYLAVWCVIGVGVAGLFGLEVFYWKTQGRDLLSRPNTETIVRDCSTTRRGEHLAMIIGHRTRLGDTLSTEVVLKTLSDGMRQIHLPDTAAPYRVALSEHGKIAVLTAEGHVLLSESEFDIPQPLDQLGLQFLGDLEFSANGRYLALQSENVLIVWEADGRERISETWPSKRARFLSFFEDEGRLLEATATHLRIRELPSGAIVRAIRIGFTPSAARVSPSGELALLCSGGYEVRMWNLTLQAELWQANSCSVRSLHLATNDTSAFYLATSRDVVCCSATTGRQRRTSFSNTDAIHGMRLMDNSELLSWDISGASQRMHPHEVQK